MRLRDIQQVLTNTIGALQITVEKIPGSKDMEIQDTRQALGAIEALKQTEIFTREITALLSESAIVNNVRDTIVVPPSIYSNFVNTLASLRERASVFLGVLNEFIGEQDPHSIGVKLPPRLDLEQTADTIRDLDKLLQQALVNPDTDGTITLRGFDRGSEWLEIGLGSMTALTLLSQMVQFYFRVKEKSVELEGEREHVRTMRLGNDLVEKINESLTRNFETYREQELNKLLGKNNEQNERIKLGRVHTIFVILSQWSLPNSSTSTSRICFRGSAGM